MTRADGCLGSGGGQVSWLLPGRFWWLCRAALEAEAVIAGLEDMAVMGEPVEQGRGHLGVGTRTVPADTLRPNEARTRA